MKHGIRLEIKKNSVVVKSQNSSCSPQVVIKLPVSAVNTDSLWILYQYKYLKLILQQGFDYKAISQVTWNNSITLIDVMTLLYYRCSALIPAVTRHRSRRTAPSLLLMPGGDGGAAIIGHTSLHTRRGAEIVMKGTNREQRMNESSTRFLSLFTSLAFINQAGA